MTLTKSLSLGVVAVFILSMPLLAHEGSDRGRTKKIRAPNTLSETWREIKEHEKRLREIIEEGKLRWVHEIAFEIRDLVKVLPAQSAELPHDRYEKVKTAVEKIKRSADLLDRYSDYGDKASAEAEFRELVKQFRFIESQYPEGFLEESKSDA